MTARWNPADRVYPLIDTSVCTGRGLDPHRVATACLDGGARLLQLRVKSGPARDLLALADDLVAAAGPYGARIIINDRPDIARMAGAAGVHVGQDDLPPEAARRVLGAGLLGISTHDERQVHQAADGPGDYIAVGPIFDTATKDTGYAPRGLALVRYAAATGRPVVAIGGITLATAGEALAAGASAVAVISDLLATGDIERRVRDYVRALDGR